MTVRFFILFVLLQILFALPAWAESEVFRVRESDQKMQFSVNRQGHKAYDMVSTYDPIHIRLDRVPIRIEMRVVYQGSVSEDGAWFDLPQAVHITEWKSLPPLREFDFFPEKYDSEPQFQWPIQLDCKAAGLGDACARWTAVYKKCHLSPESGACSLYQSVIELKISYAQEIPLETLIFNFQGGC